MRKLNLLRRGVLRRGVLRHGVLCHGVLRRDYLTKREVGLGLVLLGLAGLAGPFLSDLLGAGNYAGIGPLQRLILIVAGLVTLVGLSLLPLGDRPA